MKNSILTLSFLLLFTNPLFPEKFSFKFNAVNKQNIEATVSGKQFVNKKFSIAYTEYFKTIRTVKEIRDNAGLIEDTYYFYNQNKTLKNKILEIKNSTFVDYLKDPSGKLTVYDSAFYPTVRNVPVFPDANIEPGYKWTANGTEIQDMFNDRVISIFPIVVQYTFLGYEELGHKKLAKFKYEYAIKVNNEQKSDIDQRILRVDALSTTIMYFDNELGTQIKEEYKRDYSFLIKNASEKFTLSFVDEGSRSWHNVEVMNKANIVNDIKKEITAEKIENTNVVQDDKGINIQIENINFLPDSVELVTGENGRITKLAEILRKYKNKGILIIGHTALAGTEVDRQKLSIERAQAIADYLVKQDAIDPLKTSILGKGATEPVTDNTTEEKKKKNRRVEIFILEE